MFPVYTAYMESIEDRLRMMWLKPLGKSSAGVMAFDGTTQMWSYLEWYQHKCRYYEEN